MLTDTIKKEIYTRLQNTIKLKQNEFRKVTTIGVDEYITKYKSNHLSLTSRENINWFTEIHGYENALKYRYDVFTKKGLNSKYDLANQIVVWIENDTFHKKRFYSDELVMLCGEPFEKSSFINRFFYIQEHSFSNIFYKRVYSIDFLYEHIDRKRLDSYIKNQRKRKIKPNSDVVNLLRKLKIDTLVNE
jgi:hypothetical protein